MALENQSFLRRAAIAIGTDFFLDQHGVLDYALAMEFRTSDSIHEVYDFHWWTLADEESRNELDLLNAWGLPVTQGIEWPDKPTREGVRKINELLTRMELIHAKEVCTLYRVAGRKNLSTVAPEILLSALRLAAGDAAPDALRKHLRDFQIFLPE